MTWVTWKQHRLEGLWALVAVAALAAAIGYLILYESSIGGCVGPALGYCFANDFGGQVASQLVHFNLFTYALVVFPALAGAFLGAPLVAREVENGTHRLAWTQGVTRSRWLLTKLGLIFFPLLLSAAAVGILEVILLNQHGPQANHWDMFDQQAPVTVAATAFALALGVAAGAVIGRSVPAMAVTLLAFVATRVGIAELARPGYIPPLTVTTQDQSSFIQANPTAWWLDSANFRDAAGHVISNGLQLYQPGNRFWTFQIVESSTLTLLAVVVLGFAIYWVNRRVS